MGTRLTIRGFAQIEEVDLLFGSGISAAWKENTEVVLDGKEVRPSRLSYRGRRDGKGEAFFISPRTAPCS